MQRMHLLHQEPTCTNSVTNRYRPVPQCRLAVLSLILLLLLLLLHCMQHSGPQLHHHISNCSSTCRLPPHRQALAGTLA
jgi:hypothetical protein